MGQSLAKVVGYVSLALFAMCSIAQASCSDVISGGRMGPPPNVDASAWPSGACYIDFPGGHTAEREKYGSRCRALDGYVGFQEDRGTNYNRCLYRPDSGKLEPSDTSDDNDNCDIASIFPRQSLSNLYQAEATGDYDAIGKALDNLIYADVTPNASCDDTYYIQKRQYVCARMAAYYLKTGSIAPYTDNDFKLFKCEVNNSRDITKKFLARLRADKLRASQAPAPSATPAPTPTFPQPSPPMPVPQEVKGDWGAYVHVHSTKFYGVAKGYNTEKAAIAAAMNMCRIQQDNGITTGMTAGMDTREQCEVVQTVNNGCISVALYDGAWGAAIGDNEKEANTEALDACEDKRCRISRPRSLCSLKSTSAFSPGDQASGGAQANSAHNSVQICSAGRRNADVVLLYKEPNTNKWIKRGWYKVKPGTCMGELVVGTGDIYLYAHDPNEESVTWSGNDTRQCVPRTAFTRYNSTECGAGEMNVGFKRITTVSGGARYKHQLTD
ncbi:DUF4189 domain-containing protein [Methylobacterium fujisawaense]